MNLGWNSEVKTGDVVSTNRREQLPYQRFCRPPPRSSYVTERAVPTAAVFVGIPTLTRQKRAKDEHHHLHQRKLQTQRQNKLVDLNQYEENEDHRRSHLQAQDGTSLDRKNKETRELTEQCLQCHLTRSLLPPDEAETTRDELGHVVPYHVTSSRGVGGEHVRH